MELPKHGRAAFAAEFGTDPVARYPQAVRDTRRAGLLQLTARRLRLTQRGRLLANEALLAFAS